MTDKEPARAAGPMTTRSYRLQSPAHTSQSAAQQSAAGGEASSDLEQQRLDMPDTFVHQPAGGSRSMRFKQQQHAKQHAWQKELEAFKQNQRPAAPTRLPTGKQSILKPRQAPNPPDRPASRASISVPVGLESQTEQDAAFDSNSSFSRSNADAQQLREDEELMLETGASLAMNSHKEATPARRALPQPLRMSFSPESGPHSVILQERPASRARSSSPHERQTARVTAGGWHGHWQSARSCSPVAMPDLAPMSLTTSAGSVSTALLDQAPQAAPDRLEIADY